MTARRTTAVRPRCFVPTPEIVAIQPLESRLLLAGISVGVYATRDASESSRPASTRGEFIFKRPTGSTVEALTLEYYVRNTSTAVSGVDFEPLSGSVVIPAGKRSAAINVFAIDDDITEPTETITVSLKPTSFPIVHRSGTVSIGDNDTAPATTLGVYAGFPNASETLPTTTGRGQVIFKRPVGSTAQPLTVNYYVRNTSTATSGQDFEPVSGVAVIPADKRSVAVDVFPIDDAIDEPDETIVISVKDGNYTVVHRSATITIADNDEPPPPIPDDWFVQDRHFRAPISVQAGSFARTDQPIDVGVNFTDILTDLSASGSLLTDSIRIVEVSADGQTLIDNSVPFQFDEASNYDASTNAAGNLVVLVEGNSAANSTRHFQIYFDTEGSFSAPNFTPLVTTTSSGITDEGFDSIRIETQLADYYYHKAEGGFSSIIDSSGNDWITWHPTGGSAGNYRGIPNMGPAGFHPGSDSDITTTILAQGPLKTTLESVDPDGNRVRWEFYPKFARCIVLSMNQNYYFLYEGTPGGSINGNDTVVESDGTVTGIGGEWSDADGLGSANGQEWIYFRDSGVGSNGRYLYLVHNEPDDIRDTYWNLDNNMTVFGFGRFTSLPDHNTTTQLLPPGNNLNNVFTIGLADGGGDFNAASATINGVYRGQSVTFGTPGELP